MWHILDETTIDDDEIIIDEVETETETEVEVETEVEIEVEKILLDLI